MMCKFIFTHWNQSLKTLRNTEIPCNSNLIKVPPNRGLRYQVVHAMLLVHHSAGPHEWQEPKVAPRMGSFSKGPNQRASDMKEESAIHPKPVCYPKALTRMVRASRWCFVPCMEVVHVSAFFLDWCIPYAPNVWNIDLHVPCIEAKCG